MTDAGVMDDWILSNHEEIAKDILSKHTLLGALQVVESSAHQRLDYIDPRSAWGKVLAAIRRMCSPLNLTEYDMKKIVHDGIRCVVRRRPAVSAGDRFTFELGREEYTYEVYQVDSGPADDICTRYYAQCGYASPIKMYSALSYHFTVDPSIPLYAHLFQEVEA